MTRNRRVILIGIGVAAGLFVALLVYNLTTTGWQQHAARLEEQVKAAKQAISAVQAEQARLAKEIRAVASALRQKQNAYEAKAAGENDEKLKAVWDSYKLGLVINRGQVLKIGDRLDDLRGATEELARIAVVELEDIQRVVSGIASSAKTLQDSAIVRPARNRIDVLQGAITVATQLVAQAKNEVAEQKELLGDQRGKFQALYPAGSSMANPVTREITAALETILKDNEKAQDLLERFDQSVTGFGKAVFSISDILKAQAQFLDAVSKS